MRDLANSIAVLATLAPAARTASADGTGVDLKGFESATVIAEIGAEGITLSGTDYITFSLEHSDDDSTYTAVASADVVEGTVASGVFATYDADAEAPAVATIGYVGGKRYVRAVVGYEGTHGTATPTSAVIVKGHPRHSEDA